SDSAIAPVNRDADLKGFLSIDHHSFNSFSDHGLSTIHAARARYLQQFTAANSHLVGELCRHFDERLRHKLHVHGIFFRPIVVVLSQAVRGANDVVVFSGAVFVGIGLEFLHNRIIGLLRMQRVFYWAFDRLVMLGEGAVSYRAKWNEQAPHALGVHDEW